MNFKAVLVLPKTASSAQTQKYKFHLNCLEHSICISLTYGQTHARLKSLNRWVFKKVLYVLKNPYFNVVWQNYFWWKILATWDFSKYLTLKKYLWKRIKMLVQKWFNFTVMTLAMQWALFLLKSEHVQKFYPYLCGHHAFRVYLSK